jgi:uncharacterized protein (TIGR03083 family)
VDVAAVYDETSRRLLDRAAALGDADARRMVPALPGWTVTDTYAHLSGLCVDVLDGRTDGAGSPEWSGRQVAERETAGLDAVCAEWAEHAPDLVRRLRAEGGRAPMFVAFDVWTHHQDLRGALGVRGEHDDGRIPEILDEAVRAFDTRFRAAGVPAIRVVTPVGEHRLGDGAPVATLHADRYELLRILFARRSAAQMRAARWDGDPGPALGHLHLFELPAVDLDD